MLFLCWFILWTDFTGPGDGQVFSIISWVSMRVRLVSFSLVCYRSERNFLRIVMV